MPYFHLRDGSVYESYICLGCIFLNKVIWPAVSSSSMLFPMVPTFVYTLWTLTKYCCITFGRKERKHIVLKTFLPTFGRTTLFQNTKAQMWHLLEVLTMLFCSSSFFLAILQTANRKEVEDAQAICIFMELIWLLTRYSESAGPFANGFVSSSYSWALIGIFAADLHSASDPSEHAEGFSLLPVYEKLAENYLWGFYLSSQLMWATGFKCVYTRLYTVEPLKPCFQRESG